MPNKQGGAAGHADADAVLSSLRSLLTSLLLLAPPDLSDEQLSDNLLMRHRMLGLSSSTPYAHDMLESSTSSGGETSLDYLSIADDVRTGSQHDLVAWLSRPPIELGLAHADVRETAQSLFLKRLSVLNIALQGDKDPINPSEYELLCSDAWHAQGRILVRFPNSPSPSGRLLMMVIRTSEGTLKLDNLLALRHDEALLEAKKLHAWTPACAKKHRTEGAKLMEQEEESGGAEYITQAEDFWAGFSDEELVDEAAAPGNSQNFVPSSTLHAEGEAEVTTAATSGNKTVSENAIRDIIRGAYTLHRSLQPALGTAQTASIEAFIRLVRSTIADSP